LCSTPRPHQGVPGPATDEVELDNGEQREDEQIEEQPHGPSKEPPGNCRRLPLDTPDAVTSTLDGRTPAAEKVGPLTKPI
jgi:hypothetical protein